VTPIPGIPNSVYLRNHISDQPLGAMEIMIHYLIFVVLHARTSLVMILINGKREKKGEEALEQRFLLVN